MDPATYWVLTTFNLWGIKQFSCSFFLVPRKSGYWRFEQKIYEKQDQRTTTCKDAEDASISFDCQTRLTMVGRRHRTVTAIGKFGLLTYLNNARVQTHVTASCVFDSWENRVIFAMQFPRGFDRGFVEVGFMMMIRWKATILMVSNHVYFQ